MAIKMISLRLDEIQIKPDILKEHRTSVRVIFCESFSSGFEMELGCLGGLLVVSGSAVLRGPEVRLLEEDLVSRNPISQD